MRRDAPSAAAWSGPLVIVLLYTLAHAAPGSSPSGADGGRARHYFKGLKLKPATVSIDGARRSNILWVTVDATRPDHLGTYGYSKPTSPWLDLMSKDAVVFVNAFTNAPWTRPSVASMLTGLYPSTHQTQTDRSRLPDTFSTVAQDLQKLGYRTAAVIGNGNVSRITGLDRGFDDYVDTVSRWQGLPTAADIVDEASTWLRERRPADKPWMLFLFLVDAHDPYHAPPAYEAEWLKGIPGEPRRTAHWEYRNRYTQRERRSMQALYDAAIRYTDDQLRRLWEQVAQLGLDGDTTLIFSSDHGEGFGEHGFYLHAYHHHEEFIRVPLVIRSPAWRGSGHALHQAQLVDLRPTVVALAGGAPDKAAPGQDLGRVLAGSVDRDRVGISEYNEFGIRRSAIFDFRTKVILQLPADKQAFHERIPKAGYLPSVRFDKEVVRVYDLVSDPGERTPVPRARWTPRARQLLESLRAHMQEAPAANSEVDPATVPKEVLDDLRSLGYVQ